MSTPLDTDFVLVNRGTASYKVAVLDMYDKIQADDWLVAQKGTTSYRISGADFIGKTFDSTTYFLINRGALSYKILGDDLVQDPDPRQDTVGAVAYWGTSTASLPADWYVCNGQQISAATYPELAALLPGGGGLITLPNLVSDKYLIHTNVDADLGLTVGSTVREAALTSSPSGFSNSVNATVASWSGTATSSDHTHSHSANGRNDFNSAVGSYHTAIPHYNGSSSEQHRGTDSSWNYMTFGGVTRWNHSHITSALTFNDNGSHSHTWSTSMTASHSHGSTPLQAQGSLDGATNVELKSYSLVPIIYAGVPGLS